MIEERPQSADTLVHALVNLLEPLDELGVLMVLARSRTREGSPRLPITLEVVLATPGEVDEAARRLRLYREGDENGDTAMASGVLANMPLVVFSLFHPNEAGLR